jgi:SAM-dependent methyltransferase
MIDTDLDARERSRRRVIDVGTGPGTVATAALARGAEVVAVDAEPSMRDAARRNALGAQVQEGVLPRLPFPAGGFDAAVANFVLNHVGDSAAGLAELRRVVRPAAGWRSPSGPPRSRRCNGSGARRPLPRSPCRGSGGRGVDARRRSGRGCVKASPGVGPRREKAGGPAEMLGESLKLLLK